MLAKGKCLLVSHFSCLREVSLPILTSHHVADELEDLGEDVVCGCGAEERRTVALEVSKEQIFVNGSI